MPNIILRSATKAEGLKRYFTGEPCIQGHVSTRSVANAGCDDCRKVWRKTKAGRSYDRKNRTKYVQTYPDKVAATSKKQNARPEVKAKQNALKSKRRAILLGADSERVDLQIVWVINNGWCYLCQSFIEKGTEHYDHMIPLTRGGTHTYANIRATHGKCNLQKNNKTPEEYWEMMANA